MDTTHTDRQHEGMASAPSTASATENENGPMPDAGAYLPTASLLTPAAIAARDAAIDHGSSALENATSRNDESEAPPSSVSSSGGEMATDSGGNQHGLLDELEDAASSVNANEASHSHGHMICQPVASPAPGDVATAATGDIPSIAVTIAPLAGDVITPVHRRSNSSGTASVDNGNHNSNRKKRLCRFPGCTRVIKSQGHCQRHGAKAKRCKVEGCEKQAQGTHNGMCKRHWRAVHFPDQVAAKAEAERKKQEEEQPPPPVGESVYDTILPASIAYRPSSISVVAAEKNAKEAAIAAAVAAGAPEVSEADVGTDDTHTAQTPALESGSAHNVASTGSVPSSNNIVSAMPLVTFLRDGALQKEVGWHRQAERRARGMFECPSLSCQLEPWEKQLALVEILLLSGGTPHANFKDLAHAWGRERGFHQVLASSVCTRRGEVERKKRSDAGKRGTVSMSVSTSTAAAATSSLTSQSPSAAASAAASASATVPHRKRAKFNTLQQQQQTLQQQVQQIQEQQLQSQQQQLQHQLQQVQFQQQVQHQLHLQQQFQQVQFQQNPTTPPVLLPQGQQPAQQLSELATTTTAATTNTILAMASGAPETALLSTNTNNDSPTAGSSDDINTAVNAAVNGNTEGVTTASINLGASGGVGMGESTGIP